MTTFSSSSTTQKLVSIDGFLIDVALSEEYTFDSAVTDFPVESGSSIVDNIRPKPIVVRIEGIVSNTPIGNVAQARQSAGDSGNGATPPPDQAYDVLQKIRDAREPVVISTSLRIYNNMALQSLSVPRATGRGDELRFNATFKQVTIVKNKRTTRVATPGGVGNHAVNATPKPFGDNGVNAGVITIFQIPAYLANDTPDEKENAGRYLWFDTESLGGWRHEALNMSSPRSRMLAAALQSVSDTPANQTVVTDLAANDANSPPPQKSGWVATRGRPWGVSQSDWENNQKSDSDYRKDIAAANAANPQNQYNPILTTQTFVPFYNKPGEVTTINDSSNIRRVKATIR